MKATKDILDFVSLIPPAVIKTTTTTGTGIDLANALENLVTFHPGAITDGTHTPKLQESDALGSGYSDVAAADQVGTLSALAASTIQQVSYIGSKRYIRAVVTVTGSPSTGGYYTAAAVVRYRKQP
jgi:hypothetical protein